MLSEHEEKSYRQRTSERGRDAATPPHIFLFLLAFRILNALSIRTFFQPDEYFQSLEPAWEMAFGADGGAWVTWEWKYRLRSAIHPAIFAAVYRLSSFVSQSLQLSPSYHADLMITAPKVLQAVFAALGDYYTWKLGERMYGRGSNEAWAALALTVCSPWQWFCSTRTLSNCLETTLTIIALHSWPWHWSMKPTGKERLDENGLRTDERQGSWHSGKETHELAKLRRCLLLAATACVLRPTNLLIWICLTILSWFGPVTHGRPVPSQGFKATTSMRRSLPSLTRATKRERTILIREAFLCGSAILFLSAIIDRLYYRTWTFPPLRFLYYNLAQSLARILRLYEAYATRSSTPPLSSPTPVSPIL
ncbi:gpi mannosyltransferase 3 [Lasallia pustulata]|uniref:Mannosyltransferase n=1 Tax=Lasallia pustulata TaxID=136370 RepID=A0A1W5CZC3_9LECA|nr:gpi mannosyltransferase 3 [Lasallia pustulata]